MKYPIVNRRYFLRENEGYVEWIISQGFGVKKKAVRGNFYSKQMVDDIVTTVFSDFKKLVAEDPSMSFFIGMGNEELYEPLIFSFGLRRLQRYSHVVNIEILTNWLEHELIKEKYTLSKLDLRMNNIWKNWNSFSRAVTDLFGKHEKNLRFGNIHLSMDTVLNRQVFGVHWDAHYPKVFTRQQLMHLWRDKCWA